MSRGYRPAALKPPMARWTDARLSDRMRGKVIATRPVCPTCHRPTDEEGIRKLAARIGVSHSSLWRFLRGGVPSAALLDAIDAWDPLAEAPEQPE